MNQVTIVIEIPDVGIVEKDAVLLPHGYGIEVKDRAITEALAKASFHGQEWFGTIFADGNQSKCAMYFKGDSMYTTGNVVTSRFVITIGRFVY